MVEVLALEIHRARRARSDSRRARYSGVGRPAEVAQQPIQLAAIGRVVARLPATPARARPAPASASRARTGRRRGRSDARRRLRLEPRARRSTARAVDGRRRRRLALRAVAGATGTATAAGDRREERAQLARGPCGPARASVPLAVSTAYGCTTRDRLGDVAPACRPPLRISGTFERRAPQRAPSRTSRPVPPRSALVGPARVARASSRWKSTWKRSRSRTSPGPATCAALITRAPVRACAPRRRTTGPRRRAAAQRSAPAPRCRARSRSSGAFTNTPHSSTRAAQRRGDPLRLLERAAARAAARRRPSRPPTPRARPRARRRRASVMPQIFTLQGRSRPYLNRSGRAAADAWARRAAVSLRACSGFRHRVRAAAERDADRLVFVAAAAVGAPQPDADRVARLLRVDVVGEVFGAGHRFAVDRDDDVAADRDLAVFGAAD